MPITIVTRTVIVIGSDQGLRKATGEANNNVTTEAIDGDNLITTAKGGRLLRAAGQTTIVTEVLQVVGAAVKHRHAGLALLGQNLLITTRP